MKKILSLSAVLLCCQMLAAQSEIFISNADKEIAIISIGSGGCSQNVQVNTTNSLSDITLHPSGNMYGVSFSQRKVYEVNMTTGALTEIAFIAEAEKLVGLTADASGTLYVTEGNVVPSDLYTVDVMTGNYTNKGPLLDGSAGDLSWSFGKLYNASDNNKLVEVNIDDPANSLVIGAFNGIVKPGDKMFALVSVFVSCIETVTYGLSVMGDYYEIDLETANVTRLCTGSTDLYGATSADEFLASECTVALDLDADNSSGMTGVDFQSDFDCLATAAPIADDDTEILVSVLVDSLSISLINGIQDGSDEYLEAGVVPGIVSSPDGQSISAVNTGNVPEYDVEDYLELMRYRNTATPAAVGTRTVQVVVFSEGERDTAYAYINFSSIDAGGDGTVSLCENSSSINLYNELTGSPDPGGVWLPALPSGTGIFDPGTDAGGIYMYIVSDGCTIDTAQVDVSVLDGSIDVIHDTTLCQATSVVLDADVGVVGATYLWNTGATTHSITVNTAGEYIVEVTVGGCSGTDTTQVDFVNIAVDLGDDFTICSGDNALLDADTGEPGTTYQWNTGATSSGLLVTTDGLYSVIATLGTCTAMDSVTATLVTGGIIPVDLGPDQTICEGQSITISSGYSTAIYNHSWNTGSTNASITTSSPGIYSVTLSNDCQSGSSSVEIFTMDCDTVVDPPDPVDTTVVPPIDVEPFCEILLPLAFTPNGDSHNDVFGPLNLCPGVTSYLFRIYNRYGELLFEGDLSSRWDGSFKGEPVLQDVYIWYLQWTDPRRGDRQEEGTVIVIR